MQVSLSILVLGGQECQSRGNPKKSSEFTGITKRIDILGAIIATT
jgi:hypothetical protein